VSSDSTAARLGDEAALNEKIRRVRDRLLGEIGVAVQAVGLDRAECIVLPESMVRAACRAGGLHLSLTFGPEPSAQRLGEEQREVLDDLRQRLAEVEREREPCPGTASGVSCTMTRGDAARGGCYVDGCPFRPAVVET
jgi:hypothetical protein